MGKESKKECVCKYVYWYNIAETKKNCKSSICQPKNLKIKLKIF